MGVRKLLEEQRLKLELRFLSKGRGIIEQEVIGIPETKETFPGTKDSWVKLSLPKDINATGCIYYGNKNSQFPPHKHPTQTEQITILNPEGKMTIITDREKIILEYPNSYFFESNQPHAVIFNEYTVFSVIWHPAFKQGWEAEVKK